MKLYLLDAGSFTCDGGSAFGVIPKAMWNRVYPCGDDNTTRFAMRCLLVDTGDKKILIDAGVGQHYNQKIQANNGHSDTDGLALSLKKIGVDPSEITDVLFTHLHWDHCNGAVITNADAELELMFKNATHWCSKKQWEHSFVSNMREKAAYYRNILDLLKSEGNMQLIENDGDVFEKISVRIFDGHTPGNIVPLIDYDSKTYVFTGDFVPTSAHIPIIWLLAYDLYPVKAMEEKELFLKEVADNNYILLFEHDYYTECATVKWTDKGSALKCKLSLDDTIGN